MIQVESVKHIYGFDRGLRASLKNMSKVKISIPVDENGNIDIEKQKEVIDCYNAVQEIKKQVREYREKIKKIKVEIKDNYELSLVDINRLFKVLPIKKKIKKESLQNHTKYPVYSSQIENYGLVGYFDEAMFKASEKEPLITFGDHTRILYVRTTSFSVLDNVKVLKPIEKKIDINYVLYIWKQHIPNLGYSRHWKEAKKIKIPIPIKPNGEFDIEAQKEIAHKYQKIEEIKQIIDNELKKIEEIRIDYE
jgi:hypothetical protein